MSKRYSVTLVTPGGSLTIEVVADSATEAIDGALIEAPNVLGRSQSWHIIELQDAPESELEGGTS